MNKTWGRTAAILSIAMVLTACNDKDEPSATPTPTASTATSSPSASPSVSASASTSPSTNASVPAAAQARTEAGAIAFVNFYAELLNKGTLDPRHAPNLFEYADKDCIACKKNQDLMAEYAKGGWSVKQPGIRLEDVAVASPVDGEKVILNFTFVEAEQPLFQNGKETANKIAAARTKKGAALRWVNGAWQMYGIENL